MGSSQLCNVSATYLVGGGERAGATLTAPILLAYDANGAFVENGVAGVPMCVIYEDFASDVLVTGYSVAPGEIIRVLAGGAITKGDNVVGAANGRVTSEGAAASARSANTLGTALEAASGTGVVIRVRMGK